MPNTTAANKEHAMKTLTLALAAALLISPLAVAAPAASVQATGYTTNMQTLTPKQQNLAAIAAPAAAGDMAALKTALNRAFHNGLTVNEAKSTFVQLYAYCGFPRSLNALNLLMETVNERQAAGKTTAEGRSATAIPAGTDMLARGTETQTGLVGQPVQGALFDFAPDIDRYLKAHLFGDIFADDVLNWQEREVVTIAALGSMSGVDSQLTSHLRIGRHNGLTDGQMAAITQIIGQEVGTAQGGNAKQVLQRFIKQ